MLRRASSVRVFDAQGVLVVHRSGGWPDGRMVLKRLNTLSPGAYFLEMVTEGTLVRRGWRSMAR
jgi:hypothetical protein